MLKHGLLIFALGAGAVWGVTFDPRLSVHTVVREDIFAGFMANDQERLLRGEKNLEILLTERPDAKAALLAWKGSIAVWRAVIAHEAKKPAESESEYRKALEFFVEAAKAGPEDGGVMAINAASWGYFGDRLPEKYRAAAWKTSYENYKAMWKQQAPAVDNMPLHLKGELLAGMTVSSARNGQVADAQQFAERIVSTMPETAYASLAAKWKDGKGPNLMCHSCHDAGRLEARRAALK
jgi:hypothetical protein